MTSDRLDWKDVETTAKHLLGYTIASDCRIVLAAQIFNGALGDGQIAVKITESHAVNWLLRLPQCDRDALLQKVMTAADTILSDAFDEHLRVHARPRTQRTRVPATATV